MKSDGVMVGATSCGCAKITVAQHLIRAAGPYGAASLSTDPYGHTTRMGSVWTGRLELIRCTASHIHIHTDLETDSVNEP
ncbi:MAG: hypothetical protein U9R01_09045 [candidate division WOR-3 bacterium]|nr:hypothetical protein [candidate division WOR-3 bacterium]